MTKKLLLTLSLMVLPSLAMAQSSAGGPGSGTDLHRVLREVDAMQRDGRWQQLLADNEANRLAAARQVVEPSARPTAVFTGQAPARPRPRKLVR